MALNFPTEPTVGQVYHYNRKYFQWDGSAWKQLDSTKERQISEYTDFYNVPESSSVSLDLRKYNSFDLTINETTAINVPSTQPYSKFVLKLNKELTETWSLLGASYDNVSFLVSGQDTFPFGIFFKPDGTKMYMVGLFNASVYQFTLSTPWSLSTAVYDSVSFLVSGQDTFPFGIFFKPDGTKMYMVGYGNDRVYQYTLSTAWNLATATYDSVSFLVSGQDTTPLGIFFKPDGTKMYMLGSSTDGVYQYTLSTAWNLATASYDSVSFLVSGQEPTPAAISFKPDGTKMYMVGYGNDRVYQYTLSTAWNLATASYDNVSFLVSGQDTEPYGIFFKPDGTKMYITGGANDRIYQYDTSGALPTTITWSDNVKWANNTPTPFNYQPTQLFEFTTYDGRTWVPILLSETK